MSSMKMSDCFDLPVSVDGLNLNDGHLGVEGDTTIANFDYEFVSDLSESMAHHAAHAINNHDRLMEENAQQRESLDAFRELVKLQTQTMNDLNEKCKGLAEDNAELREALQSALNIKNLWLPETNMIVHTDEFCALHKMHDSFKKLL